MFGAVIEHVVWFWPIFWWFGSNVGIRLCKYSITWIYHQHFSYDSGTNIRHWPKTFAFLRVPLVPEYRTPECNCLYLLVLIRKLLVKYRSMFRVWDKWLLALDNTILILKAKCWKIEFRSMSKHLVTPYREHRCILLTSQKYRFLGVCSKTAFLWVEQL
jgi:hypothetical protein